MELIAYKGDRKLKTALLKEIKKHEKADAILQGTYGRENGKWKGCAVACSLRSLAILNKEPLVTEYNQHADYETKLGIPRVIARLEDRIFEGLDVKEAKKFPAQFAAAIKPGADLSLVWPKFAVWLLVDKKDGVLQYAKSDKSIKAITRVAELYSKVIAGEQVEIQTWEDARSDAADAADAAAAADAYAAYAAAAAAADAADAADAYAAAAAYAAADAADAARRNHYSKCAKKLISLLKEAN